MIKSRLGTILAVFAVALQTLAPLGQGAPRGLDGGRLIHCKVHGAPERDRPSERGKADTCVVCLSYALGRSVVAASDVQVAAPDFLGLGPGMIRAEAVVLPKLSDSRRARAPPVSA